MWCNKLMIPLFGRPFSDGGEMHQRCAEYVAAITQENQKQYNPNPEPYSYEDFLARIEDEDGGW